MVLESFVPLILVEGGNDLLRWPLRDKFKLSKLLNLRKPKYISHICLTLKIFHCLKVIPIDYTFKIKIVFHLPPNSTLP